LRSLRRSEGRSSIPQSRRIEAAPFIIDDGDIFGDGVNIAVRLEGIAEPGGICISDDAHRQISGKVDTAFDDMGPQTLKNIAEPTRVWRVRLGDGANPAVESTLPLKHPLALPDKPSIAVPTVSEHERRSRAGLFR